MTVDMIEIDGGKGEGGGQILRTAVALAALTGVRVKITNVRAGRPVPGLAPQHLAALKGVASLCDGTLKGASIGSTEIEFQPGTVRGGRYVFDVGTAGSVTLVAQACLLALARCDDAFELLIMGGTDVNQAPSITYDELVLFPLLRRMGYDLRIDEVRRGFYPRGGGMVRLSGRGCDSFAPLDLDIGGKFQSISGTAFVQNVPTHVAERMAAECERASTSYKNVKVQVECGNGPSAGAGIVLCATYENTCLGASSMGKIGVSSENVARIALKELEAEMSMATLDVHAADQLLPYMALCDGPSRFTVRNVTTHLSTQMELLPRFLPVLCEAGGKNSEKVMIGPNRT